VVLFSPKKEYIELQPPFFTPLISPPSQFKCSRNRNVPSLPHTALVYGKPALGAFIPLPLKHFPIPPPPPPYQYSTDGDKCSPPLVTGNMGLHNVINESWFFCSPFSRDLILPPEPAMEKTVPFPPIRSQLTYARF